MLGIAVLFRSIVLVLCRQGNRVDKATEVATLYRMCYTHILRSVYDLCTFDRSDLQQVLVSIFINSCMLNFRVCYTSPQSKIVCDETMRLVDLPDVTRSWLTVITVLQQKTKPNH